MGPARGTFSSVAAETAFRGRRVEFVSCATQPEIPGKVARGELDYGVVAIQTGKALVADTVIALTDLFQPTEEDQSNASIVGEVSVPIHLFLLGKSPRHWPPRVIRSHPEALRQCRRFIAALHEQAAREGWHLEVDESQSTGRDAALARQDPTVAILASMRAASLSGLRPLRTELASDSPNFCTKFWILGREHTARSGSDLTALHVSLKDCTGSFRALVNTLTRRRIDIRFIYPSPIEDRPGEYTFLVLCRGHKEDEDLARALNELRQHRLCAGVQWLGSYPSAERVQRNIRVVA